MLPADVPLVPRTPPPAPPPSPPLCAGALVVNGNWTFFNSKKCGIYAPTHQVYVAAFRQPCTDGGCLNFGMFEVISASDPALPAIADDDQKFAAFMQAVQDRNPNPITMQPMPNINGGPIVLVVAGTYQAAKQATPGNSLAIDFNGTFSAEGESSMTVITAIAGVTRPDDDDWTIAQGDLIRGASDGRIEIGRAGGRTLTLDLSDEDNPKREVK